MSKGVQSALGNGQNFFAKLLFESNNLRGSGRIFALLLPQKKDRFHIPGYSYIYISLNFKSDTNGIDCINTRYSDATTNILHL